MHDDRLSLQMRAAMRYDMHAIDWIMHAFRLCFPTYRERYRNLRRTVVLVLHK